LTSANAIPTPYQIFNQKRGSPYSKKRFYELVKFYHPDRHDHHTSPEGLSYATKLERYRLIIAANAILSDPIKRGAYDTYGAGWNGHAEVAGARDYTDPNATWGGFKSRGWNGPRGPSQNATWEDWERYYQQDAKGSQEPKYVSNSAFVGLILVFAAIGGIGQASRAGNAGLSFIEQTDALHNNVSKDLMRRRREATTLYGSREERLQYFLRQRDPIGYGLTDPKAEAYRKLLPEPEICSSGDIKQRSMDVYHQNGNSKKG